MRNVKLFFTLLTFHKIFVIMVAYETVAYATIFLYEVEYVEIYENAE